MFGKNNTFGHPSISTIEKLQKMNVKIYRTDEMGEIDIFINRKIEVFTYATKNSC